MGFPTVSLVILAACVVGMEQTKDIATDDLIDVVMSLKNEVAELRSTDEAHEKKYKEQQSEIETLKKTIREHNTQESELEELRKKTGEYINEVEEIKKKTGQYENEVHGLSKRTAANCIKDFLDLPDHTGHSDRRALQERVAFSTYLSHEQQHTGIGQKIKFDGIILNEGNGYNPHLGAFVAPASGLYLFSYSISKWRVGMARVSLVKNGNAINGAVIDARTSGDHQASNVAPVDLVVGDVVYVEEYTIADVLIWGHPIDRWTTFSGVLLF